MKLFGRITLGVLTGGISEIGFSVKKDLERRKITKKQQEEQKKRKSNKLLKI